jgi:rubrerythrin
MSFLDKIKDTASVVANKAKETGTAIGDASKTAIEKQKVKSAISKENANITKQYTEIGKKYVELFGEQPSVEFAEYIEAIKASREEVQKLTLQLNELDDYVTCSCGAKVPKSAGFCPSCGNAVAVASTTAQEVATSEVVDAEPVEEPAETVETAESSDAGVQE